MQEKTKLYVDKNTPNVDKNTLNVDKNRAKKRAKSKAGAGHTMKNTRKGARGATASPPKEKRPPAGGSGRGLTGAAPPTATDKSRPLRYLMAVADKKGLLPRSFDCLNQGANLSRLLLRGNP